VGRYGSHGLVVRTAAPSPWHPRFLHGLFTSSFNYPVSYCPGGNAMVLAVVFARDLRAVMMVAKWLALDGPFVFSTPLVAGSVTGFL
jgi:hypothetical protein